MRYIAAAIALFIAFSFGLVVRGLTIESEMQLLDDCLRSSPLYEPMGTP